MSVKRNFLIAKLYADLILKLLLIYKNGTFGHFEQFFIHHTCFADFMYCKCLIFGRDSVERYTP